jgi:hypothetical protein
MMIKRTMSAMRKGKKNSLWIQFIDFRSISVNSIQLCSLSPDMLDKKND